ncbi:MAG: hypothetical protein FWJ68_15545, partial [Planifilum fulgidum]
LQTIPPRQWFQILILFQFLIGNLQTPEKALQFNTLHIALYPLGTISSIGKMVVPFIHLAFG